MNQSDTFMNIWNYMEFSEKQRLMRAFLRQHGDHFSRDDFVRFLAVRFTEVERGVKPMPEKSNARERRA